MLVAGFVLGVIRWLTFAWSNAGSAQVSVGRRRLDAMVTPPLPFRFSAHRPARWQAWVLNALYNFDRHILDDWLGLMASHLQGPDGATPMATARYTVQLMGYAEAVRIAAQTLAAHGHPAGRSLLADAALDFKAAEDLLYPARDALLAAAGADRVTDAD
jgi:hypothetical protein